MEEKGGNVHQDNTLIFMKNPERYANPLSRVFFCFLWPLMCRGYKRYLEQSDLHTCLPEDEARHLTDQIVRAWEKESRESSSRQRRPSLLRVIRRIYGWKYFMAGILLLLEELVKLCQPLLIGYLVRYFRYDKPLSRTEAYIIAGGLAFTAFMYPITHHPYFYALQKIGLRIRVACSGLVFDKTLRLSSGSLRETSVGQVVNILSNDVAKFDQAVLFLHHCWVQPVCFFVYLFLLWQELGVACLAGFGAIFSLLPLQAMFSRQVSKYRRKIVSRADKRIGLMSEILSGIRVIKMYTWEWAFAALVDRLRRREMYVVRLAAMCQSFVMGLFASTGQLVILFAILAYILPAGDYLSAERIFVSVALYNSCRLPLTLFLPLAIQFFFESLVTIRRIEKLLSLSEVADSGISRQINGTVAEEEIKHEKADVEQPLLELRNFSAKWNMDDPKPAIQNISFCVKPGQLVVIIGPVGAGKSAILSSILGECITVGGEVVKRGSLAFVPQEAWTFSGTLKQNILFGEEFNEQRYDRAIQVCALEQDLKELSYGDSTSVGDRGVVLSGGQKARVNFARAVYRNPDIYLLDDPLSAVDVLVGRHLFERCIREELGSKIVLLATHQLQYLHKADLVLVLENGKVAISGTFNDLKRQGDKFTRILRETEESYMRLEMCASPTVSPTKLPKSSTPLQQRLLSDNSLKGDSLEANFGQNESIGSSIG